MSHPLTIGQVAAQAGVRADTIRYYEKCGLIPKPARRPSGYRAFGPDTVVRIRFIKRAQQLGFTLDEIGQMLRLRDTQRAECADVQHLAERKIALIDAKVADLRAIRGALQRLVESCQGHVPIVECPILESLEHGERT